MYFKGDKLGYYRLLEVLTQLKRRDKRFDNCEQRGQLRQQVQVLIAKEHKISVH